MVFFFGFVRAAFTIELIAQFPFESVLHNVVSMVFLEKSLYLFHQLIQELVSVALNNGIDGDSFVGDEGIAEFFYVDASFIAVFETRKDVLELQDLVFCWNGPIVSAVNGKEILSEMGDHEELLHKAVDVAGRSQVLESAEDVPLLPFGFDTPICIHVFPPLVLSEFRGYFLNEHIDEVLLTKENLFDRFVQCFKGDFVFDPSRPLAEEEIFHQNLENQFLIIGMVDVIEGEVEEFECPQQ